MTEISPDVKNIRETRESERKRKHINHAKEAEELGIKALNIAYQKRMQMLHSYTTSNIRINKKYGAVKEKTIDIKATGVSGNARKIDIPDLVETAKKQGKDVIAVLSQHIPVREVIL